MADKHIIETDRPGLVLMQMSTIEDDREYLALQNRNREHFARYGNRVDRALEEVTERRSSRTLFGIYKNGQLIGVLDFVPHADGKEAEIGISLSEESTGQGFATAAVKAGVSHMRSKFERLFAEVSPDNEPSIRLCRRVGLVARPGVVQREWGPALVFDHT